MMLYPDMQTLLSNVNSRYLLVNVIAKRARDITERSVEKGDSLDDKPVSMAIKDIAAGIIHVETSERF